MATRGSTADLLVDTSVAIALVQPDHPGHEATFARVSGAAIGLAGHAMHETYSVLTRLPRPQRLSPAAAQRLIATDFPRSRQLSAKGASALLAELVRVGIAGGGVYDALVGATAREHDALLLSRDRRAAETYRALGVRFELV
ncbi:type II toxin-antitoxin system VapC family toxin [Galbitalea sp. SE-J8]|uniref:type II toxin-antitoxin system VapC family toxin n=1 Tax=Galbitalea sp. SE-J8 TaxID=3054952 RepID=UPI00259C7DC9|nr:type II toxin-antitoxin system VapC family toxin [Galbitalea sp. SE-J8]MDM4761462.1 type II toxin-antitoxin system VapC family toxin [Galbitalea sp. SE-J8]